MRTRGGPMVGVDAEVDLGTIVGLEPLRVVLLHVGWDLQRPIVEDADEKVSLGLDDVGRNTEIDVVEARHLGVLLYWSPDGFGGVLGDPRVARTASATS